MKPRSNARAPGGFTMLEMLVVIGIIGLLASITLLIGRGVIRGSKVRQTEDLLHVLDSLLTEYEAEYKAMPPYTGRNVGQSDVTSYHPPTGFREGGNIRPEVAVFLAQVKGLAGADRLLASIPGADSHDEDGFLIERADIYWVFHQGDPQPVSADRVYSGTVTESYTSDGEWPDHDDRLSMRDAWGMEILYVHPDNQAATGGGPRRQGTFAGYGEPKNRRPYFVSAGPDFRYDTLADNVYSYHVEPPAQ